MSDDAQAPADVQDTPTTEVDTPQLEGTDPASEQQDTGTWEQRYQNLQPQFTKVTQELAELKKAQDGLSEWQPFIEALNNPEQRRQAIQWLLEQDGYELPDDEETSLDTEGEDAFRDPRVDEMLQREQEREATQALNQLESHVDELVKDKGLELTARQRKALIRDCIDAGFNMEATAETVDAWAQELSGYRDTVIKGYRESKKGAPPPPVSPGASGTEQVPLDTEKDRRAAAMRVAEAAFRDVS